MNNKISWFGLRLLGLCMLMSFVLIYAASGVGASTRPNKVSTVWDTATLLTVDAVPPYFDFQGGPEDFSFSFISAETGTFRVARVQGESVDYQTVAHSPETGGLTGVGNDLSGSLLSYSLPKEDGSSAAALARWDGSWSSEILDPSNGGGSTFIANIGLSGFPFDSAVFYSGPNGLFAARENEGEPVWSSTPVDPEAKADTQISLAFDRMSFPSLAYCGHTAAGDSLQLARLDYDTETWHPHTLLNQTCTAVIHFGAWFGNDVGRFFFSSDEHLNDLSGEAGSPNITIIDTAPEGGWIGRGLSSEPDIYDFQHYWISYAAFDPASGLTSLHVAFNDDDGEWHIMDGPAGDFAAWTYLQEFTAIDDQPVKISVIYYDNTESALKRATWPPDPDIFLPIIHTLTIPLPLNKLASCCL